LIAIEGEVMNRIRYSIPLLLLIIILFAVDGNASENLLYAESFKSSTYKDELEIFSINLERGGAKPIKVFSSARTKLNGRGIITTSRTRLFINTYESVFNGSSWETKNHGIYEIFMDGSNRYKMVFPSLQAKQVTSMVVSHNGELLALFAYDYSDSTKRTLYIYNTDTGRQVVKLDLSDMMRGCHLYDLGWLLDDSHLFFTLDTQLFPTNDDYQIAGTYLLNVGNKKVTKLSKKRIMFSSAKTRVDLPTPRMIGVLGNGSYLFTGFTGKAQPYYSVDMENGRQESMVFPTSQVSKIVVSHTGKFLGIMEWYNRSVDAKVTEAIWIKQLKPNRHIRVLQVHAPKTKNIAFIGWSVRSSESDSY
jgi:hypothetical protein